MTQSVNDLKYQKYQRVCEEILKEPEIRFAGFVDYMGNLILGDFRNNSLHIHLHCLEDVATFLLLQQETKQKDLS